MDKETGRVEAFSDGVFAIALTLLVLELRLPDADAAGWTGLLRELAHLWPKFLSFALSFATILIMWVNHHGTFRYIRRVDAHLLFTNGLLLLFVTFVPFPTAVLGDFLTVKGTSFDARVAAGFYALTYVAINIAWVLMWQSITHNQKHVAPDMTAHDRKQITASLVVGFVSYSAAVALAFFNAVASVVLCMLLAVFWTWQAFRYHPEGKEAAHP